MALFSLFPPWGSYKRGKPGPRFPTPAGGAQSVAAPQIVSLSAQSSARGFRGWRTPPSGCSSGLGGPGRSCGAAGGKGRSQRVGDTFGDGGGAAAAPRPGNKPTRCGSVLGAGGEETAPRRPTTPTPSRDPAPVRPRRPPSHSSPSRSGSPPSVVASVGFPPAAPRSQRSERPGWRGASSRHFCLPALSSLGFGLYFEALRSALSEPATPAYALALSGSLSDRQHELQRGIPPADQYAGPHDPRGVRP